MQNKSKRASKSFLDFGTVIQFDRNKNISRSKQGDKEFDWDAYQESMQLITRPFLHFILINGIQSGKLTVKNFLVFLRQKSWIGKPYVSADLGGKKIEFNWLSLIVPSITEFFIQVRAWGASEYYTPNFVLCIDSLTMKMEGLLRNLCQRTGIPTSTTTNVNRGIQEVYVHNIIENEALKKFFSKEDLQFFKYLLSNEGGLNLRNNIAHSFYTPINYHPDKMLLLICLLFRISLPRK